MAAGDESTVTLAIERSIADYGWAVIVVGSDGETPQYAYTIGLTSSFAHPELIVFGLKELQLKQTLDAAGKAIRLGRTFHTNTLTDELTVGILCAVQVVHPDATARYLGIAESFFGRAVEALHIVWPDAAGFFPWDSRSAPDYRRLQPRLS
jgi:Domain of unknown function (DUF4262)